MCASRKFSLTGDSQLVSALLGVDDVILALWLRLWLRVMYLCDGLASPPPPGNEPKNAAPAPLLRLSCVIVVLALVITTKNTKYLQHLQRLS